MPRNTRKSLFQFTQPELNYQPNERAHYERIPDPEPGFPRPPPPPGAEILKHDLPRREYSHLSDPFWNRGQDVRPDKSGSDLEQMRRTQTVAASWSRTAWCPNRYVTAHGTPEHVMACPLCNNDGVITWSVRPVQVSIHSISWENQFHMTGQVIQGLVKLTFPSGAVPQRLDRVQLLDEAILHNEVLHREPSGASPIFRLQLVPRYLVAAILAVPRDEYPGAEVPGDPQDPFVPLILDSRHMTIIGDGSDRKVMLLGTVPRSAAVTFVYYGIPEFIVAHVQGVNRDFFSEVPLRELRRYTLDQIESTETSHPAVVVAKLIVQDDHNNAGAEAQGADGEVGHYTAYQGRALLSSTGENIDQKADPYDGE